MFLSTSRSGAVSRSGRSKVSKALDLIWRRADLQNHVLEQSEIAEWRSVDRDVIRHLGLIRRTADAATVTCEDCGKRHGAEVIRDPRHPDKPYYLCPTIGRIPTTPEAIQRWEVDFDSLAAAVRHATGLSGKVETVAPSRLWLLGRRKQDGSFWELFLARGVCWPDGISQLDQCLRLQQSPAPVILVPRRVPSIGCIGGRACTVRTLAELAELDGKRLTIDDQGLLAAAMAALASSASQGKATAPKRLPRSIGTPEAVNAAIAYMESKGLTETQFGNQFQSTDRTVRSFRRSGKMRRSTFEAMAKCMGLTIEQLLRGELPKSDRR
jgi:hypothetical protein